MVQVAEQGFTGSASVLDHDVAAALTGSANRGGPVRRAFSALVSHGYAAPLVVTVLVVVFQMAMVGRPLRPLVWPVVSLEVVVAVSAIATATLAAPRGWAMRDRFTMRLATTFAVVAVNSAWFILTFPGLSDGDASYGAGLLTSNGAVASVFGVIDIWVLPVGIVLATTRRNRRASDASAIRHGSALAAMAIGGGIIVWLSEANQGALQALAVPLLTPSWLLAHLTHLVVVVALVRLWPLAGSEDNGPVGASTRWLARALVWCLMLRLASMIGAELDIERFNAGWYLYRVARAAAFVSVNVALIVDGWRLFRVERERMHFSQELSCVLAGLGAESDVKHMHVTCHEWLEAVFGARVVRSTTGGQSSGRLPLWPLECPDTGQALSLVRNHAFDEVERSSAEAFVQGARLSIDRARVSEASTRLKDEFFTMIGHELRTPLTSVRGYAEVLHGNLADPDATLSESREYVMRLQTQAETLSGLIEGMLDSSHFLAGTSTMLPELFEFREAVGRAVESNRVPATVGGQVVRFDHSGHSALVSAVPAYVERIVGELISNAISYSRPGGTISISVSPVSQVSDQAASVPMIACTVEDDGPGISIRDQAHLFTPFFRAPGSDSRPVRGAGLGLYMAKRLAEMMHGKMTVETSSETGSRFTLHLPAWNR